MLDLAAYSNSAACLDARMCGCMDELMYACMDVWMRECLSADGGEMCMTAWIDGLCVWAVL